MWWSPETHLGYDVIKGTVEQPAARTKSASQIKVLYYGRTVPGRRLHATKRELAASAAIGRRQVLRSLEQQNRQQQEEEEEGEVVEVPEEEEKQESAV